jgi:hypothetical protein
VALYIGNAKQNGAATLPLRFIRWVIDHNYASTDDAAKFLSHAMKHAAPITHREGNKRFNDLLLTIKDGKLIDLAAYEPDCKSCNDTKIFIAHDPDGTERQWPCPDCRRVDKRRRRRHH